MYMILPIKFSTETSIAILACPCCDRRKKPFLTFRSLNNHLTKHHPDYHYSIHIGKSGKNIGQIIKRRKKTS